MPAVSCAKSRSSASRRSASRNGQPLRWHSVIARSISLNLFGTPYSAVERRAAPRDLVNDLGREFVSGGIKHRPPPWLVV
jgi:hypothetical protein